MQVAVVHVGAGGCACGVRCADHMLSRKEGYHVSEIDIMVLCRRQVPPSGVVPCIGDRYHTYFAYRQV